VSPSQTSSAKFDATSFGGRTLSQIFWKNTHLNFDFLLLERRGIPRPDTRNHSFILTEIDNCSWLLT
jgi:hypothetical protein